MWYGFLKSPPPPPLPSDEAVPVLALEAFKGAVSLGIGLHLPDENVVPAVAC